MTKPSSTTASWTNWNPGKNGASKTPQLISIVSSPHGQMTYKLSKMNSPNTEPTYWKKCAANKKTSIRKLAKIWPKLSNQAFQFQNLKSAARAKVPSFILLLKMRVKEISRAHTNRRKMKWSATLRTSKASDSRSWSSTSKTKWSWLMITLMMSKGP